MDPDLPLSQDWVTPMSHSLENEFTQDGCKSGVTAKIYTASHKPNTIVVRSVGECPEDSCSRWVLVEHVWLESFICGFGWTTCIVIQWKPRYCLPQYTDAWLWNMWKLYTLATVNVSSWRWSHIDHFLSSSASCVTNRSWVSAEVVAPRWFRMWISCREPPHVSTVSTKNVWRAVGHCRLVQYMYISKQMILNCRTLFMWAVDSVSLDLVFCW